MEENPPQSWTEELKKPATDKYFEKKLYLEPESSSVTGKVCYHYNMFDRNSGGKTSQIVWLLNQI